MSKEWRLMSIKIVIILVLICILLLVLSSIAAHDITTDEVIANGNLTIGETLMYGTSIEHNDNQARYPLLAYPNFIFQQITGLNIFELIYSLSTGSVPFDYSIISSHGINSLGFSTAKGPGFLNLVDGKLCVDDTNKTLYGKSYAYNYLVKNERGVDLYVGGKYNDTISADQIRNQNFSGPDFSIITIVDWYNDYRTYNGSIFGLEYGLKDINDGRNNLTPQQIIDCFSKETYINIQKYPAGNTICLYIPPDYIESVGEDYSTTLGDYSEYGNDIRSYNAQTFCEAWNNTIVPSGTTVCGRNYYCYESAQDSEAPGGFAAHGVCPPARALRNAVLGEGFPIPTGISMDNSALMYGYNPSTGVFVHNNSTYTVKIIFSYEGSGVNMVIHCHLLRYTPPD